MPRKTQQNKITTPELLAQINPENVRLMADYVSYMQSVKRSEQTIDGYVSDLNIFFCWLVKNAGNKAFVNIAKRDIVAFQGFMVNTLNNSPARIRRMKSSLSALSNYIVNVLDDEYPTFKNIINKVENPLNNPVREKTVLSDEQINDLLEHLVEDGKFQQACLLALAVSCGARKSELVRFKIDFFVPENIILGSMYKTPKIKTKGRSGGKYISKFVLIDTFQKYFDLWIKQRSELGIECEWLFVKKTESGYSQLSPDTITSWMLTFGKYLGVDLYAHSLRHLWCTALVRKQIPTTVIKDLGGWESTAMCDLYSDVEAEEMFAEYFSKSTT